MMHRWIMAIAFCAATALAHADAREEAKAHFKQAHVHQEAGAYALAADEYIAAYALDPRPETLFNVAQAYRLAGNKPAALDYFQRYLATKPTGSAADQARAFASELERQIAEDKARADAAPPPAPPPVEHPPKPQPAPPPATIQERRSRTLQIAGIAAAGVGVIGIGLGVKFGIDARDADQYFETHTGGWGPGDRERYEDGQAANRNMVIAYVIGGGLVATGAVLFAIGTSTHAVPVATHDSIGVAIAGGF